MSEMTETRKVLYSPGFGAGWVTWCDGPRAVQLLMLEWHPLIEAIEHGEKPTEDHPAVVSLIEAVAALGEAAPFLGGLSDLAVAAGRGQVRIDEYDGSESVVWRTESESEWL